VSQSVPVKGMIFLIGLAVAGVAAAWLVLTYHDYSASHWTPPAIWVAVVGALGIVVYSVGKAYSSTQRWSGRFLLALIAISLLHIIGFAALLRVAPDLSVLWFLFLTPAEIGFCLDFFGPTWDHAKIKRGRPRKVRNPQA
jgi:hypothetical protein